jgi:WD40 repeat protein
VAFFHDSTRLASASNDKTAKIWDASSGNCLQTLEGHSDSVLSVAFSHDSTRLASASNDKTVKIWNTSNGACLQTLDTSRPLMNISFDATSSYLYTEIGVIVISAVTEHPHPLYQYQKPRYISLSSDGAWITYHSKKLLWLPSEYRPSCSVIWGQTIGIGVGTGKVWICSVELGELLK